VNLDPAVGCARAGRDRLGWQGRSLPGQATPPARPRATRSGARRAHPRG